MPTVRANEINIYFEEHGSGEPLLLIMGWGGNAATWKPQIAGLAERFRVITFDNRGVGRTSAPGDPYSTQAMAGDVLGLMDGLGIERAHVFGISMGGMVAQELALGYPDRVGALVLGCTSPGSPRAAGAEELLAEIAEFHRMVRDGHLDFEWFTNFLAHLWTEETLIKSSRYLQDFVFSIIRFPPTLHGLHNQADAVARHDAYDRLSEIEHPTLVITGDEDSLIHPENSEILAKLIPNAELELFDDLKHAFHLERPDLVNPSIIDFIERAERWLRNGHATRRRGRAAPRKQQSQN